MRVGGEAADVDDANGIEEKVLVAALYLFNYFPIIPRPGSCCAVMDWTRLNAQSRPRVKQ